MNSVFFLIQLLLIIIFIFILFWQGLIFIAMKNAIKTAKMQISFFWILIIFANILFIVMAVIFTLITSFRMLT